MSWMTEAARNLGAEQMLDSLLVDDVLVGYARVVRSGWDKRDGANVLAALHDDYHGDRSRFPTAAAFEYSANGRGIFDLDLEYSRADRSAILLRRGLAFAYAALRRQQRDLPGVKMFGQVSVSPTLFDPSVATGNVTFYTASPEWGPDQSIADPAQVVVVLSTADCLRPLRVSGRRTAIVRWVARAAIS